jgi:hypothetical protein
MSQRTLIILALETRLKTIKTTAGFQTNIGNSVSVWKHGKYQPNELPALNVRYAVDPDMIDSEGLRGPKNIWNRILPVEISAAVKGSATIADIEKIISDVWKAIGVDDTFGALALTTNPTGDTINEDTAENIIVGAALTMNIEYRMNQYE